MVSNAMQTQLQALLYDHPMYRHIDPAEKDMNVLIFGWNEVAACFLKLALQAGQISEHGLNLTVCAGNPSANRDALLAACPALPLFVQISVGDAPAAPVEAPYARLSFIDASGEGGVDDLLLAPLVEAPEERYHYIFIATGDDDRNREIAALCAEIVDMQEAWGRVCLTALAEGETVRVALNRLADAAPALSPEAREAQLDRMAFNAHMVWAEGGIADLRREWERFMDPDGMDNRLSSRAFALSVRYKLWSAGIDADDPEEAARRFAEALSGKDGQRLTNVIAALEQRRWVMERVARGWTPAYVRGGGEAQFEPLIQAGSTRVGMRHLCLVRSGETAPLTTPTYTKNNRALWDNPVAKLDDQLDDLDRMSVDLHRFMVKKRAALRRQAPLDAEEGPAAALAALVAALTAPVEADDNAPARERLEAEHGRYLFALRAVLEGSAAYARQLALFENDFLAAVEGCDPARAAEAEELIRALRRLLFPAVEAALYRDYKKHNLDFVQEIPFILTHRPFQRMAMAFDAVDVKLNTNDHVFNNLASPTVLKPGLLLYLYRLDRGTQLPLLLDMLAACLRYLERNRVPCEVQIAVSFDRGVSDDRRQELLSRLLDMRRDEGPLTAFEVRSSQDSAAARAFFAEVMRREGIELYDGATPLFKSTYDNAQWFNAVEAEWQYFEMNPATKRFTVCCGCDRLRYIHDRSFLRIDDMFDLMNGEHWDHYYPDYGELTGAGVGGVSREPLYMKLWNLCTGGLGNSYYGHNVGCWNRFCDAVAPDNLRKLAAGSLEAWDWVPMNRLINRAMAPDLVAPVFLNDREAEAALDCLGALSELGLARLEREPLRFWITDERLDTLLTGGRAEVDGPLSRLIAGHETGWNALRKAFGPENLRSLGRTNLFEPLRFDDLLRPDGKNVRNIPPYDLARMEWVLKELSRLRAPDGSPYAVVEQDDEGRVTRFSFRSPKVARVFSKAGEVLEIYAFFKAFEVGWFDDIACSYTIHWGADEESGTDNELDLVLTKGFRSILVECKAVAQLQQSHYMKLNSLADVFGINARKVLLLNNYNKNYEAANRAQIQRGEMMDIDTISGEEELSRPGETLKRILESGF